MRKLINPLLPEWNGRRRLVVLAPPLLIRSYRTRWRQFANSEGSQWSVVGIVAKRWERSTFGKTVVLECSPEATNYFTLVPVDTTTPRNCTYLVKHLGRLLRALRPDFIFCVHEEVIPALTQMVLSRLLFYRRAKLVYFTMSAFPRGYRVKRFSLREVLKWIYFSLTWMIVRAGTDAAVCHYPVIEQELRKAGYRKPVLVQTQYGVDSDTFRPNPEAGQRIREKLGLSGYVIGFCGRLVEEKGVWDLLAAAKSLTGEWSLLLVGDGPLRQSIEQWCLDNRLLERVRIAGYVPHDEVQNHFAAMDIFVLGSHDTPTYIDTFPLVVAQAMMTGLPVIGSDGGAIPYQLDDPDLVFPQRNAEALAEKLQTMLDSPDRREMVGERLRNRALQHFSTTAMNQSFEAFLDRLEGGRR